jgi:uncharacterized damage-inducible protein DinB
VSKSIVASLEDSMERTDELARSLDDESMGRRLQDPSNTLWDQLWCIVGARESYARAITAGEWVGFACSLTADDRGSQPRVVEALQSSRAEVQQAMSLPDPLEQLILDLLLHETQHHGQLIRYVYGLGLEFPKSWRERWNLR